MVKVARYPVRITLWVIVPLLFLGSCTALLPLARRIADPRTHVPVERLPEGQFPVVVFRGDAARVEFLRDLRHLPELDAHSSYLVPAAKEEAVQRALNDRVPPHADGMWVLDVRQLAPDRQHIELYWMQDGYAGGGYEATRRTIAPRYRKITGPGFAFVFGGVAVLINVGIWGAILLAMRWWQR
jgi:hypothetical protein